MICPKCGHESENDVRFCGVCGQSMSTAEESAIAQESVSVEEEVPAEKAPKKKMTKKTKIIIGVAAGVVVVAAAVLAFLIYIGFGAYTGPLGGLKRGVYNLIDEGNFTMTIEATAGADTRTVELKVDFDEDTGELKLVGEGNGVRVAISDEMMYRDNGYDDDLDISSSDMIDTVDFVKDIIRNNDADWDAMLDILDAEDAIEDLIDPDDLPALVDTIHEYLDDEKWLEKNFGFSNDGDDYTFEFTAYDAAKALEDIFKDHIDSEDLDDYTASIDDAKTYLESMELSLTFTVDGGELVGVELTTAGLSEAEIRVTFSDIGDVEIDDEIADIIADYEEAKNYQCESCGASGVPTSVITVGGETGRVCDSCASLYHRLNDAFN